MSVVRVLDYLHDLHNEYALIGARDLDSDDSVVGFESASSAVEFFVKFLSDHWVMGSLRKHVWEQGYYSHVVNLDDLQVCRIIADLVFEERLYLIKTR